MRARQSAPKTPATTSAIALTSARYLGYFENEHGEQAIFVYDRTRRAGTLLLGDTGWERPHAVVEGAVAGVVLGATERAWLTACWKAATLA